MSELIVKLMNHTHSLLQYAKRFFVNYIACERNSSFARILDVSRIIEKLNVYPVGMVWTVLLHVVDPFLSTGYVTLAIDISQCRGIPWYSMSRN